MNVDLARMQMVKQQVRAFEVLDDRVLEVLTEVPRERFVPEDYAAVAFADTAIPIGHGQSMLTPTVEGRMLQALAIKPGDSVLEVGTGTGFTAACMARLGGNVLSIDIFDDFLEAAKKRLVEANAGKVVVERQDATKLDSSRRFDAIALTASLPVYDARYQRALAVGGRLFVVVGVAPAMEAMLITRTAQSEWAGESLFETSIPALVNARQPKSFEF